MLVMVGYATAGGSTMEIADRIAATLQARGVAVEVRAVGEVDDAVRYDAFVLGSAIHYQAWLPVATEFVERQHSVLEGRPVWLFSVGMPGALPRSLRRWAVKEEPKVLAAVRDDIVPAGYRLFSGVVRPQQFGWFGRLLFRTLGGRYGDFRDWPEIDAWAGEIARELAEVDAGASTD